MGNCIAAMLFLEPNYTNHLNIIHIVQYNHSTFPKSITFWETIPIQYVILSFGSRQWDTWRHIHPYCGLKCEKCKFVCVKADLQCPHPQADTLELLCLSWACQNNRDVEKAGMFTTSLWNQIQAELAAPACVKATHCELQSCSDTVWKCAWCCCLLTAIMFTTNVLNMQQTLKVLLLSWVESDLDSTAEKCIKTSNYHMKQHWVSQLGSALNWYLMATFSTSGICLQY